MKCMGAQSIVNEPCGVINDCDEKLGLTCQMNECKCLKEDNW